MKTRLILILLVTAVLLSISTPAYAGSFENGDAESSQSNSVDQADEADGDPVQTDGGKTVEEVSAEIEILQNPLYPHPEGEYEEMLEAVQISGTGRKGRKGTKTAEELAEEIDTSESVSYAAGVAILRSGLIARQGSITILINCGTGTFPGLNQFVVVDAAAHTGDPQGGDYLRFHWNSIGSNTLKFSRDGKNYCYLPITATYYTNAEQEDTVGSLISSALAGMNLEDDTLTDYDRFMMIYRYINDTVTYDYVHVNDDSYYLQYTAYAAISNGTAVCQGYSNLLYRMCLTAGIQARIISSLKQYRHAWNIVQIGGQYYLADATWDESRVNGKPTYNYSHCLVSIADSEHVGWEDERSAAIYSSCGISEESFPCSPYSSGSTFNANDAPLHNFVEENGREVCTKCNVSRAASTGIVIPVPDMITPTGLTEIEEYAFEGCAFGCVQITANVESIGEGAFAGCDLLQSVIFTNTNAEIDENAFGEEPSVVIYCPAMSTARTFAIAHDLEYHLLS